MNRIHGIYLLLAGMTLAGCNTSRTDRTALRTEKPRTVTVATDSIDDVARMERCRRELEALKKIDGAVYTKRKGEFDRLMSGASLYNGVRGDVGNYTQSAVDALYRFKADKLCADISADVLNGLSAK